MAKLLLDHNADVDGRGLKERYKSTHTNSTNLHIFRAAEQARQAEGLPREQSKARYKKIHTKIPQIHDVQKNSP